MHFILSFEFCPSIFLVYLCSFFCPSLCSWPTFSSFKIFQYDFFQFSLEYIPWYCIQYSLKISYLESLECLVIWGILLEMKWYCRGKLKGLERSRISVVCFELQLITWKFPWWSLKYETDKHYKRRKNVSVCNLVIHSCQVPAYPIWDFLIVDLVWSSSRIAWKRNFLVWTGEICV